MKVKNKFALNNSFTSKLAVMIDNCNDEADKEYLQSSLNFINDVKNKQHQELSPAQLNWITRISQKVRQY